MASQITGSLEEVVQTLVDQLDQPVVVVGLSAGMVATIVDASTERESPSPVRVLAEERVLKQIRERFSVASMAADLVEDDLLELRITTDAPGNQLLITETSVTTVVTAGRAAASLQTDDEEFVEQANQYYTTNLEGAQEFPLRTPPLSQVRETLKDIFGVEFVEDFDSAIESVDVLDDEAEFNEMAFVLLLAAKHEELLYEISKWGEDVGVASKATFSRTKTMLEDMGLIGTEKVPIDVGRPRLRLKLGSEELRTASPEELLAEAHQLEV